MKMDVVLKPMTILAIELEANAHPAADRLAVYDRQTVCVYCHRLALVSRRITRNANRVNIVKAADWTRDSLCVIPRSITTKFQHAAI
jgi:hypothetical protein